MGMWRAVRRGTRAAAHCICPCLFQQKKNKNKKKDSLANDTPFTGVQKPVDPASKKPKSSASMTSSMESEAPSQLLPDMKGSKTGSTSSSNNMRGSSIGSSASFDIMEGNNSSSSVSSDRTNEPVQPSLSIKEKPHQLTVDSFTFHRLLGEGGYGKVLLASHNASKELLAVKVIKKRCLIEDDIDEALIERQALEKTRHNMFITHLYGCFQTEECLFYAMEFLSGGDLQGLIDKKGPLSEYNLRILTAEIVCGIEHLHSIGIIHRDIKPLNILLDSAGHAKIADFGLAAMGVFKPAKITGRVGTPCYMAPEIHLRQPYDGMVDYFALGVTVYEMALGDHPYYLSGMNRNEVIMAINTYRPRFPVWMNYKLRSLIRKMLDKDQEKRRMNLSDIRDHMFFQNINWAELEDGKSPPLLFLERPRKLPLLRTVNLADILSSDDEDSLISPEEQQHFRNFSFISEKLKVEIMGLIQ